MLDSRLFWKRHTSFLSDSCLESAITALTLFVSQLPSDPPTAADSWVGSGTSEVASISPPGGENSACFSAELLDWRTLLRPFSVSRLADSILFCKFFCLYLSDSISSLIIFCPTEDVFCLMDFANAEAFFKAPPWQPSPLSSSWK